MTDVRSINPFELLGDDSAQEQPTKLTRNEKKILKNTENIDNSRARPQEARIRNEYPKRGGFAGKSTRAPRSAEGQSNNRRGGRGGYRGRGREFDRHSGSARRDSRKKDVAGKGSWGKPTENLEEVVNEEATSPVDEENKEVKEEEQKEKFMTLDQYLANQAKKSLNVETKIREANEDVEDDQSNLIEYNKEEEDDAYYVSKTTSKTHKVKKQKEKAIVYEIEQRFNDSNRRGRGNRNNNRGDRRSYNNKQQGANKINVDNTDDFPSLK